MSENPYSNRLEEPPPRPGRFGRWKWVAVLPILLFLAWLWLPDSGHRKARPRTQCKNNLKQILLGLHNYHDVYGTFPPAYTTDEQGVRLHSWRTLILPFIDEGRLYDSVDLTKPWSHPTNQAALDACPRTYRCETAELPEGFTSYKAVVGSASIFASDGTPRGIDDCADGTSLTLAVVETSRTHAVHWMNPHDDSAIDFLKRLQIEPATAHTGGINGGLVDGSVHFLSFKVRPDFIAALITIAGGEEISYEDFE